MAPNEEEAKRLFILRMVIDQQPRENIKCLEVSGKIITVSGQYYTDRVVPFTATYEVATGRILAATIFNGKEVHGSVIPPADLRVAIEYGQRHEKQN
jgi:hypothetical protein